MLSIVLAALRARRSSTIAVWLMACLVVAAAVGAPWYVLGARERVTVQDVADDTNVHRMIILTQDVTIAAVPGETPDPTVIDTAFANMRSAIRLPGAIDITGLRVVGSLGGRINAPVPVAYRSGVCDHVVVVGRCPTDVNDVMLSRALAGQLGINVGGTVPWPTASRLATVPSLRIVGLYDPIDVENAYWGKGLLSATAPVGSPTADAMFVTESTIRADAQGATVERLLVVTPATVTSSGPDALADQLSVMVAAIGNSFALDQDYFPLATRIDADLRTVTNTVPVLAVELILFGWFALYLVLRAMSAGRRADVGLALLRGTGRVGMWRLFGPQNAVPVVAAIPFGALAGYLVARWLAGPVHSSDQPVALAVSAAAALLVVLGALIASAVAERASRRAPIIDMLRRTPARRRGWRADAADGVVVALALFAFVQFKIGGTATIGGTSGAATPTNGAVGVAAATPALLAVVIALVAARVVAPIALRLLPAAIRAGHATRMLTAAHFARRPGIDRVFAILVVAVALIGYAVLGWQTATDAAHTRAVEQLGADRVLQIRNASAQRVLTVTRAADPTGRYAMAAAAYPSSKVLAVDRTRLAAILRAGPGWPSGASVAAALDANVATALRLSDGPLRLGATATTLPRHGVELAVDLVDADGVGHAVRFGPLATRRNTYQATLSGCPSGCAFVDLQVVDALNPDSPAGSPVQGVSIVVGSLEPDSGPTGEGASGTAASGGAAAPSGVGVPGGLDATPFGDRDGWRTSIGDATLGPAVSTGPDGLHIDLPTGESRGEFKLFDPRVFPADVSLPVPVVSAGTPPAPDRPGLADLDVFGDLTVPDRVAAHVAVLPQLGTSGTYVDLSAALRLDGGAGVGAQPQIWLRADAPASVLARIRAAGLVVASDVSIGSAEASYGRQAPFAALRFGLAIAVIALLVAAIAVITLATVERQNRAAELGALRRVGLAARATAATAYATYLCLVAAALGVGLATVAIAHLLVGRHVTVFADGYAVPPAPHATAIGWVFVAVASAVPLVAAAWYAAARLVRTYRRVPGGGG